MHVPPAAIQGQTTGRVTVALVQAEIAATLDQALRRTRELACAAADRGAALIAFPETWIPGYPAWLDCCRDVALWDYPPVKAVYARMAEHSVVVDGSSGHALRDIARECGATLVVGVVERVERGAGRGTLYNSLLTIGSDGRLLNHHRKLVPTYTERLLWGPGDAEGLRAVDSAAGRVGGLICWEHWMPLARQSLHESGEDVHVAVWPTVHERHQIASRHYALEGRCHVIAVGSLMRAAALPPELEPHPGRVAADSDWLLRGGSAIIGPDGNYVTQPVWDEETIVTAEIDLVRAREESMTLDVAGHYHRPELFAFEVLRSGGRRRDDG
jgi:nitrilase